jgi:hypothetical protein
MLILESEGHCRVADYPAVQSELCCGCDQYFVLTDSFEPLVDRVRKRSYLIHTNCFDLLEAKLKGGNNANLPAWAQL